MSDSENDPLKEVIIVQYLEVQRPIYYESFPWQQLSCRDSGDDDYDDYDGRDFRRSFSRKRPFNHISDGSTENRRNIDYGSSSSYFLYCLLLNAFLVDLFRLLMLREQFGKKMITALFFGLLIGLSVLLVFKVCSLLRALPNSQTIPVNTTPLLMYSDSKSNDSSEEVLKSDSQNGNLSL